MRVAAFPEMEEEIPWAKCVEIKRANGTKNWLLTIERALPRNGGKSPTCHLPSLPTSTARALPLEARSVQAPRRLHIRLAVSIVRSIALRLGRGRIDLPPED